MDLKQVYINTKYEAYPFTIRTPTNSIDAGCMTVFLGKMSNYFPSLPVIYYALLI